MPTLCLTPKYSLSLLLGNVCDCDGVGVYDDYSDDGYCGCFLVLRKPLLVSFRVVVWVLFSVF